jgi:hypothetical protein
MKPIIHLILNSLHVLVHPCTRFKVEGTLRREGSKPSTFYVEPTTLDLKRLLLLSAPMKGTSILIPIDIVKEDKTPLYERVPHSYLHLKATGELAFDVDTNKAWMGALTTTLADAKKLSTRTLKGYNHPRCHLGRAAQESE